MSRKRRGFDIELNGDAIVNSVTERPVSDTNAPVSQRRGPMATAITETAGSLRDRAVIEAQIRAENDALAHEHVRLKKLGLVTDLVPLDRIDIRKLTRDRAIPRFAGDDQELADLVASIRDIGLSNPIRLEAGQQEGRYELVQGFRRLAAYHALLAETGDAARYGAVPATIMPRGETLERLYRQMVDENLVRKDISFAEMAQMAVNYAADPDTAENDPDKVVAKLFASASYTKRSYIRSFIKLVEMLGDDLQFAPYVPRALGLAVVDRLEIEPAIARGIRAALAGWENRSVKDELDVLRRYARAPDLALDPDAVPPVRSEPGPARGRSYDAPAGLPADLPDVTRVSFQLRTRQGQVRCIADAGRIELRLDRDFSRIDRARLEGAVQALLDHLN